MNKEIKSKEAILQDHMECLPVKVIQHSYLPLVYEAMEEYAKLYHSQFTSKGSDQCKGCGWVKANEFEYEPRKIYLAKRADDETIKCSGRFQESDGTFFWTDRGFVPILKKQHDILLILDETTPCLCGKYREALERLQQLTVRCGEHENSEIHEIVTEAIKS